MRIILIGQAAFGAKVLETLMQKEEWVVAVYTVPDKPGGRPDALKEAAEARGLPVIQPKTYKEETVFLEYRELKPDLTVMAFVTDIIPQRYFSVPTHGTINYHPSLLPRHRGGSAINWAVIMGEKKTGLTIFWPDEGIDTGPILLQKEVEIGEDATTGSLYFNHLFPMGVDAILKSIELIRDGRAPRRPQPEAEATYEPLCDDRVAGIDWTKPAEEVFNLIRGCDPQPGAYSHLKGEKIRFYGAKLLKEVPDEAPGMITRIDEKGLHVAATGGLLVVSSLKKETGKKIAPTELAAQLEFQVGNRFTAQSQA